MVRHIIQTVFGQSLLLGFLLHRQHGLYLGGPELVGESGIRQFRVKGTGILVTQGVGRQIVVQDIGCSDSDELRGGGGQILRDVCGLDRTVRHGCEDPE